MYLPTPDPLTIAELAVYLGLWWALAWRVIFTAQRLWREWRGGRTYDGSGERVGSRAGNGDRGGGVVRRVARRPADRTPAHD